MSEYLCCFVCLCLFVWVQCTCVSVSLFFLSFLSQFFSSLHKFSEVCSYFYPILLLPPPLPPLQVLPRGALLRPWWVRRRLWTIGRSCDRRRTRLMPTIGITAPCVKSFPPESATKMTPEGEAPTDSAFLEYPMTGTGWVGEQSIGYQAFQLRSGLQTELLNYLHLSSGLHRIL